MRAHKARKLSPGVMADIVQSDVSSADDHKLHSNLATLLAYRDAQAAGTLPDTFYVAVCDPSASGFVPKDMWLVNNAEFAHEQHAAELDRRSTTFGTPCVAIGEGEGSMSQRNESIDKIRENVYRFVGHPAGGPAIPYGSVVLTTDSRKRGAP